MIPPKPVEPSKPRNSLVKAVIASEAPRLSEQFTHLIEMLSAHPVQLRDILAVMHGRAYTLLLILLSLPFCQPIPLPGFSTPFGVVIVLIGARLSLRLDPWLPRRALDYEIRADVLLPVLTGSRKLIRRLEYFLRPRWSLLLDLGLLHHLYGAIILVCGILLLLPLPVPFSNLLPALTVVLLAAGMLEKDGYFVIAGLLVFVVTLLFFSGIFLGGAATMMWLEDHFGGIFDPADEAPP